MGVNNHFSPSPSSLQLAPCSNGLRMLPGVEHIYHVGMGEHCSWDEGKHFFSLPIFWPFWFVGFLYMFLAFLMYFLTSWHIRYTLLLSNLWTTTFMWPHHFVLACKAHCPWTAVSAVYPGVAFPSPFDFPARGGGRRIMLLRFSPLWSPRQDFCLRAVVGSSPRAGGVPRSPPDHQWRRVRAGFFAHARGVVTSRNCVGGDGGCRGFRLPERRGGHTDAVNRRHGHVRIGTLGRSSSPASRRLAPCDYIIGSSWMLCSCILVKLPLYWEASSTR